MKRRIFDAMSRFFDSACYPAVYAGVCVISGVNGKAVYVPMACVLATMIILSCFFAKNKRSFIAPVLMSFYCIGIDHPNGFSDNNAQLLGYYDMDGFLAVIAVGVVAAVFLFVRLFRLGVFARQNHSKSPFLWGILLMDAAFLLNGIGSPHWQPINLIYGLLFAGVFTFFYFLFRGCLTGKEDREYVCRIVVLMSVIALLQLLIMYIIHYQAGTLYKYDHITKAWYPTRNAANLGWGVATSVGGVLVLGIPAAMYLASQARYGWVWYAFALGICAASVVLRSRSSIIAAVVLLTGTAFIGCLAGKNKKQIRCITAMLFILGTAAVVVAVSTGRLDLFEVAHYIRLDALVENIRLNLWTTAWEDLKSAPLFGVGFEKGAFPIEQRFNNVFSNMYHGIIPQFYGAMGILGICAIFKHLFDLGKTVFHRFSAEKLLLAAVPGMILAMSLVDNFFFYANYQFVYCLFLALLEKAERKQIEEV